MGVEVLRTRVRLGGGSALCRCRATDAITCLRKNAPAVVRSLEEAGNQLLTFYEFPRVMWKSIRTTNALENLNREFRRQTKTQASFSSEESAVALLFGLIASGQIQLRRIDGYQGLSEVLEHAEIAA